MFNIEHGRPHGPITQNQLAFYHAMVDHCPLRIDRKFNFGAEFLFSYDHDGEIFISVFKLQKSLRGKGIGSFAMREVTGFADMFNVAMYLLPTVLDEGALSREDLIAFYERHGFQFHEGREPYMTRFPS